MFPVGLAAALINSKIFRDSGVPTALLCSRLFRSFVFVFCFASRASVIIKAALNRIPVWGEGDISAFAK